MAPTEALKAFRSITPNLTLFSLFTLCSLFDQSLVNIGPIAYIDGSQSVPGLI